MTFDRVVSASIKAFAIVLIASAIFAVAAWLIRDGQRMTAEQAGCEVAGGTYFRGPDYYGCYRLVPVNTEER
jgi:hypothetical protein